MTGVFEVSHLHKFFRSDSGVVKAVDDVSFEIHPGQRVGIVGESGSGKSTLMKLLAALLRPDRGDIKFQGSSIVGLKERQLGPLRTEVQFVFQDPRSSLNPRMKVGSIVAEPMRSPLYRRRHHPSPAAIRDRVAEVLTDVGLSPADMDRYPDEFSGGQRQRIAIARALTSNPSVLIADEPVSALDVSVRSQVLNLLHRVCRDYQLTLLFVSHDLMVVRHLCEHIMVMRSGRVIESGDADQIYTSPRHDYTASLIDAIPRIRIDNQ